MFFDSFKISKTDIRKFMNILKAGGKKNEKETDPL